MPEKLTDLEVALASLSHSKEGLERVQEFSASISNTQERLRTWGAPSVLVQEAIPVELTRSLGFDSIDDEFTLLQGDIVRTASGYLYGERLELSRFLVLNSSCDLVPNRSAHSMMLQIRPLLRSTPDLKSILGELLKFNRNNKMYLPVLKGDADDAVGNVLEFSPIYQIKAEHLLVAQREASLTTLGWRIFASFVRTVIARDTPGEVRMRQAVENARN